MLVNSSIEGVAWPGIPEQFGASLGAVLFQMERSQYYSPEKLFDHQRHQLRALFLHAQKQTTFYRQRFEECGFDPLGDITPETIGRLPPLTRDQFQAGGETTAAASYPKAHGKRNQIRTSGTTGRPVTLYKTPLMQLFWNACALRGYYWHGRDVRGKLAVIRYVEKPKAMAPHGVRSEAWGAEVRSWFPESGPAVALNIASKLADQADWLIRENPDYILSYPSNFMALSEYFQTHGLSLPNLRGVSTMSEVVSPQMRAAVKKAWGVGTTDVYTCEETGYLATQCPDHEHYHVQSENAYVEIVDDEGNPCPPGQVGRVLFTSLHNFATPLIRYEVGDFAEWGEPCSCGRGLPVIKRIHGRFRNRMILPDGRSEFPYLGEYEDFEEIGADIKQFQYVQHSVNDVEVKLVVPEPLTAEQENTAKKVIVRALGHPFNVTLSYHDEIPRSASGKFEEFVCMVNKPSG